MKIFISTIILLIAGFFYTQAQSEELNGKTFHIKLKLIKGNKSAGLRWTKDELSFGDGTLTSKFMSKREEFPAAPCEIKMVSSEEKKIISFAAAHRNTGVSDIHWTGTIKGNKIEGSAIWTNMQGSRTYSFSGTIK